MLRWPTLNTLHIFSLIFLCSVLYPGFSAQGLQNRIQACEFHWPAIHDTVLSSRKYSSCWFLYPANAYAVITTNQTVIAGRETDFKYKIDQAVDECPTIGKVFVIKRTIANVVLREKDVLLEDVRPCYLWGVIIALNAYCEDTPEVCLYQFQVWYLSCRQWCRRVPHVTLSPWIVMTHCSSSTHLVHLGYQSQSSMHKRVIWFMPWLQWR